METIDSMRINVRVYGPLSSAIGKNLEVEVSKDATVLVLVNKVSEMTGQLRGFLGNFPIAGHDLALIVNGRNIDLLEGLITPLKEHDEVVIMQPTSGG